MRIVDPINKRSSLANQTNLKVVDLSLKKKLPNPPPGLKPVDNIKKKPEISREEKIGKRVIQVASLLLVCFIIVGGVMAYQIYSPKATEEFIKKTRGEYQEIDRYVQKMQSNIIENFHDDLLNEEGGINDYNRQQLEDALQISEKVRDLSQETCSFDTSFLIRADNIDNELKEYCSATEKLASSYFEFISFYFQMMETREELWEVFDTIPTVEGTAPAILEKNKKDFELTAKEFEALKEKFEELNAKYELDVSGHNQINISFTEGWISDMKTTASIIDSMKQAIDNGSIKTLKQKDEEMDKITAGFNSRIKNFQTENKINKESIRNYYLSLIDSVEQKKQDLDQIYYDLEVKFQLK